MKRSAVFSSCRTWRYLLTRERLIGEGTLLAVLLNPSKADAYRDDPTTTFMSRLAWKRGRRVYEAVNCFALVGTDPACLQVAADPVGPENDRYILERVALADEIVLAWGNGGRHLMRSKHVLALIGDLDNVFCLGRTQSGEPRFPRALRSDIQIATWKTI
jgi:hypothetical protein